MNIREVLQIIFGPVIAFLQKEGLWELLVDLFHKTRALVSQLIFWLDISFDFKKVFDFIVATGVFLFKLVVVIAGVFLDVAQWIVGLFV